MSMGFGVGLQLAQPIKGIPPWATTANLWRDFRKSAEGVTDTHPDPINADDAAGAYSAFAPNVLVRTSRGAQVTPTYTQLAVNPTAPANQTINLATPGTYTLWIEGPGSVAVAAGTAVGTGFGSASAAVPVVFTISTGGTVDLTVTGAPTLVQVINKGFVLPPVYSAMTVAGNQQVISGLGTQLAGGVYGFVQVDIRDPGSTNFMNILRFRNNDVTERLTMYYSSGNVVWDSTTGGASSANLTLGAWATGIRTIAFSAGTNYVKARIVGGADIAADTVSAYPSAMNQLSFLGQGSGPSLNTFGNTRLLALWYGQPDATKFDAVYAKAVQAHAI